MTPQVLPVLIPSRDVRAPVFTILGISKAARLLGRNLVVITKSGFGYAWTRSELFKTARASLGQDKIRGILLDDDILLKDGAQLANLIKNADSMACNVVSPYRIVNDRCPVHFDLLEVEKWGPCTCTSSYGRDEPPDYPLLRMDEVAKMPPFAKVDVAGLGFYYGDLDLTYRFTERSKSRGEDLNFFLDQKLQVFHFDLGLRHVKTVIL